MGGSFGRLGVRSLDVVVGLVPGLGLEMLLMTFSCGSTAIGRPVEPGPFLFTWQVSWCVGLSCCDTGHDMARYRASLPLGQVLEDGSFRTTYAGMPMGVVEHTVPDSGISCIRW